MTPSPSSAAWRDLDQASLDRAYDQTQWAPNMADVLQRCAQASVQARERLGTPLRLRYGAADIEALDFFHCGQAGAPVHVFFHGGAWRSGLAKDYAFLAPRYRRAGVHLVLPDFSWVQDCAGDLRPVAEQARRALAWVHANAARLEADPSRLTVGGHSSGAHLAAVLVTTDWASRGLPADAIAGALLLSGVYELEPVRRSARSRYLSLGDDAVHALSPVRHLHRIRHPVVVAWGTRESPEFQRQGREFADAAAACGIETSTLVEPDCNHFEMLERLAAPEGSLARAAAKLALRG